MSLIIQPKAPALVNSLPKSRFSDNDIDRALDRAGALSRNIPETLPVYLRGRLVGFVGGFMDWELRRNGDPVGTYRRGRLDDLRRRYRCSDDSLLLALSANRCRNIFLTKAITGSHTADNWYDMWPVFPTAGSYGGGARTAVQMNDTVAGAIVHGGNVSPRTKRLTCADALTSVALNEYLLVDRVLTYESCGLATGTNSMTNSLAAQRYISAGDGGLKVSTFVQTVLNATTANLTVLTYVNQDGNTGQTMPTTRTVAHVISAAAPTTAIGARLIAPTTSTSGPCWSLTLPMAAGDYGVRSLTDYTWSAAPTGTFYFVLWHGLGYVFGTPTTGISVARPQDAQLEPFPVVKDGACINLFALMSAATYFNATVSFVWQ